MRKLEKIINDINLLPKSINFIKNEQYCSSLEKKCLELETELDEQKDKFSNIEEYNKYKKILKKCKTKLNRKSVELHIDSTQKKLTEKKESKSSSKILFTKTSGKLKGKNFLQKQNPSQFIKPPYLNKSEELSLLLTPNLKLTNKSSSKNSILNYDSLDDMSSSSKESHVLTPQIYEIQILTQNYIYTTYCSGYINMFKLATYLKNKKHDIPINKKLDRYYDAVISQLLSIKNINISLQDNLGNIGYLDEFKLNLFKEEDIGYKKITDNELFNSSSQSKFQQFITKNPYNTARYTSENISDLQYKTTQIIKVGHISKTNDIKNSCVEQYLLRTSTCKNGKISYNADKLFWSNINFDKLRTDNKYASLILNTLSNNSIFKYNYIGSFDEDNYTRLFIPLFNRLLNDSKVNNQNFPTSSSIDIN